MSCLFDVLENAAHVHGDARAVGLGDQRLTYGELHHAALGAATWLHEQGVRRGDRVAILLAQSLLTVPLLYGCARLGAPFIILHEQVRGPALDHILSDAEPFLLVGDDPAALTQARAAGARAVGVDDLVMATHAPVTDGSWAAPLAVDPVCLIYTSGSTSLPKAVVSTHDQLLFAAQAIQSQLCYRPGDVVFVCLPLSFDYGLYQLFLAALSGAAVHLAKQHEAGPVLVRSLRESSATVLPAVPSMAQNLVRMLDRFGGELPKLRLLTNTGAAMPEDVPARLRSLLPGLRIQLMYGLTECKRATIMPMDEDLRRPGSCGRALPGTEVFTVDDQGRRLPPETYGEITVRGRNVMAGYWRSPGLTDERFPRRDGLLPELRTGDYGRVDVDGYLYYSGRRDDIYKSNGFRVSGIEIETACLRIPGVDMAAVLPPNRARKEAVLFVSGLLDAYDVLKQLGAQMEQYKVPKRCEVLPNMPINHNGKIDRTALSSLLD
ncbi:class I adenylate-forming enzyme family protein [Nonomuraea angiospora]|nr:AMP-binding protein [Nonomuraea angiospora]